MSEVVKVTFPVLLLTEETLEPVPKGILSHPASSLYIIQSPTL